MEQNQNIGFELGLIPAETKTVSREGNASFELSAASRQTPQPIAGYELLEEISSGGMGVVWKARQLALDRVVAIKQMRTGPLASCAERKRFEVEARAVATLNHSGIVQIFDVAESGGCPHIVMEYVDGPTLGRYVDESQLETSESVQLLMQMAEAVEYSHQRGILHRDLKPANVLITSDGQVKLTDFGLARFSDANDELTLTGEVLGTPSYMAPEQAAGQGELISKRTDVYGLGALQYFLLTKRKPFSGRTTTETIRMVLEIDVVPPRTINPRIDSRLEAICLKAMSKAPADRYATADEFRKDLIKFLHGEQIVAKVRPHSPPANSTAASRFGRIATCLLPIAAIALMIWPKNWNSSQDTGPATANSPAETPVQSSLIGGLSRDLEAALADYPWRANRTPTKLIGVFTQPVQVPETASWQIVRKVSMVNKYSTANGSPYLAILARNGNTKLYDLRTMSLIDVFTTLNPLPYPFCAYAISPNGQSIVASSNVDGLVLVNRMSGRRIQLEAPGNDHIQNAAWSADNEQFAVTFDDGFRLYTRLGEFQKFIPVAEPYDGLLSPSGSNIALRLETGGYRVINREGELVCQRSDTQFVCWAGSDENFVQRPRGENFFEIVSVLQDHSPRRLCSVQPTTSPIGGRFSAEHNRMFTVSPGSDSWLIDLDSDKHTSFPVELGEHRSVGFVNGSLFKGDGFAWYLADSCHVPGKGSFPVFRPIQLDAVFSLQQDVTGEIICGKWNGEVFSLNASDSMTARVEQIAVQHPQSDSAYFTYRLVGTNTLISSSGSFTWITNQENGETKRFPVEATGICVDPLGEIAATRTGVAGVEFLNTEGETAFSVGLIDSVINTPSFSQDGQSVAMFSPDSEVVVYSRSGELQHFIPVNNITTIDHRLGTLSWSADSRYLAFNYQNSLTLVDLATKTVAYDQLAPTQFFLPPVWHPTESRIAVINRSDISIYAVQDGTLTLLQKLKRFDTPGDAILYSSVLWDRSSGDIVAGTWNGFVDVYDVDSGELKFIASLDDPPVLFSGTGQLLCGRLEDVDNQFHSVIFRPDGKRQIESYSDTMERLLPAGSVD